MDRRRNQVARRLVTQLDDVFAEIGFDRGDAVLFEILVEPDLLGDHRLALGDDLGVDRAADLQYRGASFVRRSRPMDPAARGEDIRFVELEIEVEMLEGVILDRLADVAQRLELGEPCDGEAAALGKTGAHQRQRTLQIVVREAGAGVRLEGATGSEHGSYRAAPIGGTSPVMPASTSATWRTSTRRPRRWSLPAMFSRQPRSPASTASAPVPAMSASLSLTILSEMSGYLMQKVPPKPQHTSAPGSSLRLSPPTDASSRRGWSLTPSSRSPEHPS